MATQPGELPEAAPGGTARHGAGGPAAPPAAPAPLAGADRPAGHAPSATGSAPLAAGPLRRDWSLQRKGEADEARHRERVREAIRSRLDEVVCDEALLASGRTVVRLPLYSLREYRFRFDPRKQMHLAQGDGGPASGRLPAEADAASRPRGAPGAAGSEPPAADVLEAEVTVEDVAEVLFADLELPEARRGPGLGAGGRRMRGPRRRGPFSTLDRRRSLRENLRRNAREGLAAVGGWRADDLRFRTWRERTDGEAGAVVLAMRDVSGSMGAFKKLASRTFFFWMTRFLRRRHADLRFVFIVHHVQAREVDEATFFHLAEGGGTRVSTAYELALQVVRERYPPALWNVYPVHFTDGDNWGEADNRRSADLMGELVEASTAAGYVEIREDPHESSLCAALRAVRDPRLAVAVVRDRADVPRALRRLFPGGGGGG